MPHPTQPHTSAFALNVGAAESSATTTPSTHAPADGPPVKPTPPRSEPDPAKPEVAPGIGHNRGPPQLEEGDVLNGGEEIHAYICRLLGREQKLSTTYSQLARGLIPARKFGALYIQTVSFRAVRGYTIIAALLDELAFWRSDDSANPDEEVMNALRPAMATVPGAMVLCASSPYARRGVLWKAYSRHFRSPGRTLVWKADTRRMNPTVPEEVIAEAYANDPASAAAEYGAEFRTDIESFVAREVVDALVVAGRHELPPMSEITTYQGFVDPSGGSNDSMTLAIGHIEGPDHDHRVLDLVREVPPALQPRIGLSRNSPRPCTTVTSRRCMATATAASGRPNAFARIALPTSPPKSQSRNFTANCFRY
jgi:hypothetical protein